MKQLAVLLLITVLVAEVSSWVVFPLENPGSAKVTEDSKPVTSFATPRASPLPLVPVLRSDAKPTEAILLNSRVPSLESRSAVSEPSKDLLPPKVRLISFIFVLNQNLRIEECI